MYSNMGHHISSSISAVWTVQIGRYSDRPLVRAAIISCFLHPPPLLPSPSVRMNAEAYPNSLILLILVALSQVTRGEPRVSICEFVVRNKILCFCTFAQSPLPPPPFPYITRYTPIQAMIVIPSFFSYCEGVSMFLLHMQFVVVAVPPTDVFIWIALFYPRGSFDTRAGQFQFQQYGHRRYALSDFLYNN